MKRNDPLSTTANCQLPDLTALRQLAVVQLATIASDTTDRAADCLESNESGATKLACLHDDCITLARLLHAALAITITDDGDLVTQGDDDGTESVALGHYTHLK
jgi:hypothetical protein